MKASRVYWVPAAAVLLVGLISSSIWLRATEGLEAGSLRIAAALSIVSAATMANLLIRGLRWHFILRTIGVRLRARESALLFTALLPAILTPWALGELLLAFFLRHRAARPLRTAGLAWLAARGTDLLALILLAVLAPRGWLPQTILGFVAATALMAAVERRGAKSSLAFRILLTVGCALIAWICAGLGLAGVALALQSELPIRAAVALFAEGTLRGGIAGAPAGIAITGASLIRGLIEQGVPESQAIWTVAFVRVGTVGFALSAGIVALLGGRHRLRRILAGTGGSEQGHFDDLAASYTDEIPPHIRDRLIQTKSDVLVSILARHGIGPGARGLDIGCGQGWYLAHLAARGYSMAGNDLTPGQIEGARAYCRSLSVEADLRAAPADRLPYADATFDFAYAINVLHHITDLDVRARAFDEVLRVLKSGSPFILFEMNTINPLFRFYLSYLFPFIRNFDDGTERWISPDLLPVVDGGRWDPNIHYLTFVPDFLPRPLLKLAEPLEACLERSPFRRFSAHFAATLIKDRHC